MRDTFDTELEMWQCMMILISIIVGTGVLAFLGLKQNVQKTRFVVAAAEAPVEASKHTVSTNHLEVNTKEEEQV